MGAPCAECIEEVGTAACARRSKTKKVAFGISREWLWLQVIICISYRSGVRGSSLVLLLAVLLE